MRFLTRITALLGLILWIGAGSAYADWPPNGVHLERPAPANLSGIPGSGSDGQGGMFVAWTEKDSLGAIAFRVHHLSSTGDPAPGWTTTGVRTGTLPPSAGAPGVVPDGAGGAYFHWQDYFDQSWHVVRIAADGSVSPGWPAGSLAVADAPAQIDLVATGDGAGGILFAWQRSATGLSRDIVTQRILPNGSLAPGFPAAGRKITTTTIPGSQPGCYRPRVIRDADRGFWVSFTMVQVDTLVLPSKYAVLHLDPSGIVTPGQDPNGFALSLPAGEVGTLSPHAPVAIAPDGSGGVFAFTVGSNGVVRAFDVTSDFFEAGGWPEGGLVLASGAGWPSVHFPVEENWPVASGDLAGSAYVGWRNNADFLLHGCRVNIDGTIAAGWASTPVVAGEMTCSFVADAGGLFASSMSPSNCAQLNCTGPMMVNRMTLSGELAPGWPASSDPSALPPGLLLAYGGPQDLTTLSSDGSGGVLITWVAYPEYYATRLLASGGTEGVGQTPVRGPGILRARFDPASGVRVSYSASWPVGGRLELFDVAGRRLAIARVEENSGEITLPGTRVLPSGLCFVQLQGSASAAATRVLVTR